MGPRDFFVKNMSKGEGLDIFSYKIDLSLNMNGGALNLIASPLDPLMKILNSGTETCENTKKIRP